jgi:hypothetical protein
MKIELHVLCTGEWLFNHVERALGRRLVNPTAVLDVIAEKKSSAPPSVIGPTFRNL